MLRRILLSVVLLLLCLTFLPYILSQGKQGTSDSDIGQDPAISCYANYGARYPIGSLPLGAMPPSNMARWLWGTNQAEMISRFQHEYPQIAQDVNYVTVNGEKISPTLIQIIENDTELAWRLSEDFKFGFGNPTQNLFRSYADAEWGSTPGMVRCMMLDRLLKDAYSYLRDSDLSGRGLGFDRDYSIDSINIAMVATSFMDTPFYRPTVLDPKIYGDHPFVIQIPEWFFELMPDGHVHFSIGNPDASFLEQNHMFWGISTGGPVMLIIPSAIVDQLNSQERGCVTRIPANNPKTTRYSCALVHLEDFYEMMGVGYAQVLGYRAPSNWPDNETLWSITTRQYWVGYQQAYAKVMPLLATYSQKTGYDFNHLTRIAYDTRMDPSVGKELVWQGWPSAMDEWFSAFADPVKCPLQTGDCVVDGLAQAQSFAQRTFSWLQRTSMFYESWFLNYYKAWASHYLSNQTLNTLTPSPDNYHEEMKQFTQHSTQQMSPPATVPPQSRPASITPAPTQAPAPATKPLTQTIKIAVTNNTSNSSKPPTPDSPSLNAAVVMPTQNSISSPLAILGYILAAIIPSYVVNEVRFGKRKRKLETMPVRGYFTTAPIPSLKETETKLRQLSAQAMV